MEIERSLVEDLYREAEAARWQLAELLFAEALQRSLVKAPAPAEDRTSLERHLRALHLRDLALARACEAGIESAWDHFVREYRPTLYRSADAIDPQGGARELADSLYGDLFGLDASDGTRRSLFRYFHGRSSLATWLRAVLAQRHVDRLRAVRRSEPLPDDESAAGALSVSRDIEPERGRYVQLMRRGLSRAIAALDVRDRLRLACYYAQDLTLAQTGKLLAEHEATTSRQLARTRKWIRQDVERQLTGEQGLSEGEVDECFASVAADAGTLSLSELLSDSERADDRPAPNEEQRDGRGGERRKKVTVQRSRQEGI